MERKIITVNQFPFSVMYADVIVVKEQFALVIFNKIENGDSSTSWGLTSHDSIVTNLYVVFNNGNTKQIYENIITNTISQSDLSLKKNIWHDVISGEGSYTGWKDWVTSSGLYNFTIDQVENVITITFYREENYGNFEYGNGYSEYQYTITIKLECLGEYFSENSKELVSLTHVQIQNRQPY